MLCFDKSSFSTTAKSSCAFSILCLHASFTPLVYSTNGYGMAKEARIADKTRGSYSDVIDCMRTKFTFAMLRSVLISVRGSCWKAS